MTLNFFSIESEFSHESYDKVPYDGYADGIYSELQYGNESLAFLESYERVMSKNTHDKIKMLNKISKTYGKETLNAIRGAFSLEDDNPQQNNDQNQNQNNNDQNNNNDTKKEGFGNKIKGMVLRIWNAIKSFFSKLVENIRNMYVNGLVKRAEQVAGGKDRFLVDGSTVPGGFFKKIDEASRETREGTAKSLMGVKEELAKSGNDSIYIKDSAPRLANMINMVNNQNDPHKALAVMCKELLGADAAPSEKFCKSTTIAKAEEIMIALNQALKAQFPKIMNNVDKCSSAIDNNKTGDTKGIEGIKSALKVLGFIQKFVSDIFKTFVNATRLGMALRSRKGNKKNEEANKNKGLNKKPENPNEPKDNYKKEEKNLEDTVLPICINASSGNVNGLTIVMKEMGDYTTKLIGEMGKSSSNNEQNDNNQENNAS